MKPYNLSLALFFFRTKKGKTQKQLAELAGVKQNYISHIETENKKPTLDTFEKILDPLGVSFSQFFDVAERIAGLKEKKLELVEKMLDLREREIFLLNKIKSVG